MLSTDGLTRIARDFRSGADSSLSCARRAAIVGASVKRDRCLRILERFMGEKDSDILKGLILALGVRQVLGFERGADDDRPAVDSRD